MVTLENSKTDLTHAGDNMERLSLHVLNSLKVTHNKFNQKFQEY